MLVENAWAQEYINFKVSLRDAYPSHAQVLSLIYFHNGLAQKVI